MRKSPYQTKYSMNWSSGFGAFSSGREYKGSINGIGLPISVLWILWIWSLLRRKLWMRSSSSRWVWINSISLGKNVKRVFLVPQVSRMSFSYASFWINQIRRQQEYWDLLTIGFGTITLVASFETRNFVAVNGRRCRIMLSTISPLFYTSTFSLS